MARRAYAKRYAQAVFEIAAEKGELDRWRSDLGRIAGIGEDSDIVAFLESPKFPFGDKVKLLSEQLGDISPLALNLVHLLVAKGGIGMAGEIAGEYRRLLDSYRGIEEARVTTVIPLDDDVKERLQDRLGDIVGKKVVVESEVDSSLVGGLIARIGGKLLDGSTRGQLEALKREIRGTKK